MSHTVYNLIVKLRHHLLSMQKVDQSHLQVKLLKTCKINSLWECNCHQGHIEVYCVLVPLR